VTVTTEAVIRVRIESASSLPPMAQAGSSSFQTGTSQLDAPDGGLESGNGAPAQDPAARANVPPAEQPWNRSAASGGFVVSEALAPEAATDGLPPTAPPPPQAHSGAVPSPLANNPPPPPDSAHSAPGERTRTPAYGERTIAEAELLCFANPRPGRPYEISIELPEFTCKCPFSGYPDFAVLRLIYQPGPRVVELKAIKLYVNSYRDRTISHEEVANRILDDLVEACEPVWMELSADFNPRGNVHTVVRVSHGIRQPC
jgi:7-cyano-7-deazaguanine reductase